MQRTTIATLLATIIVVPAMAMTPAKRLSTALLGEPYFKCSSGYTFQVSGNNARCRKAGQTETLAPTCPPFSALKQNVNGNRDRCQAANGSYVDYICPPLFPADIKSGADKCTKESPASVIAPAVPVTL